MKKRNTLFIILSVISMIVILYALVKNYLIDPEATQFLSHKTGLRRELKLRTWLNVMYVHIAFACIATAAGLLNFSNRILAKNRKFHRINGYVYVVSVLIVVLTSGYMAPYATGGKISSMGFNAMNMIWMAFTITALVQIKRKRIAQHRGWMMRSYAFCFTNVLIHLTTSLVQQGFGFDYAASYSIGVYASLVLLLILPNFFIYRSQSSSTSNTKG
ncbi:DUF2306 domain-containing protein [Paenibacillus ihumii]|uniref:DUF2306 domain-containing protein n=1 Tax=Paenibacillus ihumii TaxID=687436 RepID=UPI0006D81FC3|nr:DUF2306 domain-containing protein [Paenibacillus ihumii]